LLVEMVRTTFEASSPVRRPRRARRLAKTGPFEERRAPTTSADWTSGPRPRRERDAPCVLRTNCEAPAVRFVDPNVVIRKKGDADRFSSLLCVLFRPAQAYGRRTRRLAQHKGCKRTGTWRNWPRPFLSSWCMAQKHGASQVGEHLIAD